MLVSLAQARCLHLAAQGLLRAPTRRPRRSDVAATVERMQLLQIDTIHVVARSPYLVLYSRLGDYPAQWLDDSLAAAEIGETWAHEACFAPVHALPLHRRHVIERRSHWASQMAHRCQARHGTEMTELLGRIHRDGELRSSDFVAASPTQAGWWGWKPEKRWLEACFLLGQLMVSRRDRFQRVYDLPERVLPSEHLRAAWREPPPGDLVRRSFIEGALIALGVARPEWLADYFRLDTKVSVSELRESVPSASLIEVRIAGLDGPFFVHSRHRDLLDRAARGALRSNRCVPLSPFDPVVWDRKRALELFDFDYRLECYLPAAKRRYGYFVLPLLQDGKLIGRLDAKAHRRAGVFEVRQFHLQQDAAPRPRQLRQVATALAGIAAWHGTPQLEFGHIDQPQWRKALPDAVGPGP